MNESRYSAAMSRRGMLARLAGAALSYAGLTAFTRAGAGGSSTTKWDDRFELAVQLEIAQQEGARYHRPYVAVWVEDSAGRPVRTLGLWVNTSGRGPRYIKELRKWTREAQGTQSGGNTDLISTVSSATRLPGQYSLVWNGRDDRGAPVDQGTYRVFIEAAREHGGYEVMEQTVDVGTRPVAATLAGNGEIAQASVEYRRRK